MYLMRRQSEGSCYCERRRSGSRRCDGDVEDCYSAPQVRNVGTNVRTSLHLEDDSSHQLDGQASDGACKMESSLGESVQRHSTSIPEADRPSSTSHSGKSSLNEGIASVSSTRNLTRPTSARPSNTPSRAASSSYAGKFGNKVDRPPQTAASPEKSPPKCPGPSSPSASTLTTKNSPTSRGDFSQLSSPRFGESATMLEERGRSSSSPQAQGKRTNLDEMPQFENYKEQVVEASRGDPQETASPHPPSPGEPRPEEGFNEKQTKSENEPSPTTPHRSSPQNDHEGVGLSAENISMFLPKINYVTLMLGRETESSGNIESLALKYLKDDELAELAGLSPRSSSTVAAKVADNLENRIGTALRKCQSTNGDDGRDVTKTRTNFSFATKKYLMKYGLINERSVSFVVPDENDEERHPEGKSPVSGADPSLNADIRSTSTFSASPSRRSNMVLDLHKIQHLPKLT